MATGKAMLEQSRHALGDFLQEPSDPADSMAILSLPILCVVDWASHMKTIGSIWTLAARLENNSESQQSGRVSDELLTPDIVLQATQKLIQIKRHLLKNYFEVGGDLGQQGFF